MDNKTGPELFYTGLVSALYDPLVGEIARAEDYKPFLMASGGPALEVFCGSGSPLVDLLKDGIEVHGLDSSQDMLDVLARRASEAGVQPTVFCQTVQDMDLPQRYPTIFIAGASMTLLPSDDIAQQALAKFHQHLEPGGQILIPLETPSIDEAKNQIGQFKEKTLADGTTLRVGAVAVSGCDQDRRLTMTLRYERINPDGSIDVLERDWERRWWQQDRFRSMMKQAGFGEIYCMRPDGTAAEPDDQVFLFIARK